MSILQTHFATVLNPPGRFSDECCESERAARHGTEDETKVRALFVPLFLQGLPKVVQIACGMRELRFHACNSWFQLIRGSTERKQWCVCFFQHVETSLRSVVAMGLGLSRAWRGAGQPALPLLQTCGSSASLSSRKTKEICGVDS